MKRFALIIFALVLLFAGNSAKVFTVCSLVQTLRSLAVPHDEMADWVCIAKYESNFNTTAIIKNKNGSRNYGLFQINEENWCKGSIVESENYCKVSCNRLLSENITKSLLCAKFIKHKQGWAAWGSWKNNCLKNKPNVNDC